MVFNQMTEWSHHSSKDKLDKSNKSWKDWVDPQVTTTCKSKVQHFWKKNNKNSALNKLTFKLSSIELKITRYVKRQENKTPNYKKT